MLRVAALLSAAGTACLLGSVMSFEYQSRSLSGEDHAARWRSSGPVSEADLAGACRISVGGQVKRPGERFVKSGTPLIAALELAGGLTEFGSIRRVTVARSGTTTTYNLTRENDCATPLIDGDRIEVAQVMILGR